MPESGSYILEDPGLPKVCRVLEGGGYMQALGFKVCTYS